jgi:hypothetical protein
LAGKSQKRDGPRADKAKFTSHSHYTQSGKAPRVFLGEEDRHGGGQRFANCGRVDSGESRGALSGDHRVAADVITPLSAGPAGGNADGPSSQPIRSF